MVPIRACVSADAYAYAYATPGRVYVGGRQGVGVGVRKNYFLLYTCVLRFFKDENKTYL